MADLDLKQAAGLPEDSKTRYVDLGGDVYAQLVATVDAAGFSEANITTATHTAVTVNGNTLALAANNEREYALIVNDSDQIMYIKFGAAAVANESIRINASGGSYEISPKFGNLYRGAIYAIHAGGAEDKTLLVTEGV